MYFGLISAPDNPLRKGKTSRTHMRTTILHAVIPAGYRLRRSNGPLAGLSQALAARDLKFRRQNPRLRVIRWPMMLASAFGIRVKYRRVTGSQHDTGSHVRPSLAGLGPGSELEGEGKLEQKNE